MLSVHTFACSLPGSLSAELQHLLCFFIEWQPAACHLNSSGTNDSLHGYANGAQVKPQIGEDHRRIRRLHFTQSEKDVFFLLWKAFHKRKNRLFPGSEQSGETASILYSLTMTCKRHCIDVEAYLVDVFRRIRNATGEELESLLPDRWIEAHPEARVQQRVEESQAAAARKRLRRAQRRATRPARLAPR